MLPDLRIYLYVQIEKNNQFKCVSMIKGRQPALLSYVKNGVGYFPWYEFNGFLKKLIIYQIVWYMCVFVFGFVSLSICARTQRTGSRRPRLDLCDNFRIFGRRSTGNTVFLSTLFFGVFFFLLILPLL